MKKNKLTKQEVDDWKWALSEEAKEKEWYKDDPKMLEALERRNKLVREKLK